MKPRNWKIAEGETATEAGGVTEVLDLVRDRGRARIWTHPPAERPDMDAADDDGRTEGPRGKGRLHPAARRPARRQSRRQDLEGIARRGNRAARLRDAALRAHHRRRPGRHRARRAAAPARRAHDHRREERPRRRFLAQPLQVALPARPGLVRSFALHRLPEELAGVLAQGQDRRLAGDVHQGHGAELLDRHHGQTRRLGRRQQGMDRRRRARWQGDHAQAEAAGVCDRHVRQAEHAAIQGHGHLQG